jgi:hypothetical protein
LAAGTGCWNSAVKIQSVVRGFAARKRVAKVLEKQRKNREKKQIRQQNKKKKGKKNMSRDEGRRFLAIQSNWTRPSGFLD